MFDNFPAGEIEHFTQGIIVGEAGFVPGDLPELAVQALDNIGRVYDFPNFGWICEKGAQNIPIFLRERPEFCVTAKSSANRAKK